MLAAQVARSAAFLLRVISSRFVGRVISASVLLPASSVRRYPSC
jgi:hypothetical protein